MSSLSSAFAETCTTPLKCLILSLSLLLEYLRLPVPQRTMQDISEGEPLLRKTLDASRRNSPRTQIAILCVARMLESWVFFTIFPFIAAMIEDLGVEQSRIGFYSGFVEAAFACAQCIFTFLLWISLSDKYGRKPVFILSLAGLSISATLFGFSRSIPQMIFFRSIAGVFSGSLT